MLDRTDNVKITHSPQVYRIQAAAVGIALALFAFISPCWWDMARDGVPSCNLVNVDFAAFYTAAKLVTDNPATLYDLTAQRSVQQPLALLPYFYPPFFAFALAPLAWLSYSGAFVALTLLNLALLALSLMLLMKRLNLSRQQSTWLILAAACNYGVYYALLVGQTSFISLAILTVFATATRPQTAGIAAGLLFFKPSLAAAPMLALIVKNQRKAVGIALGLAGCLLGLSFLAIGLDGVTDYLSIAARAASGDTFLEIRPERMQNLRALIGYFVSSLWLGYVWLAAIIAIFVLTLKRTGQANFNQLVFVALLLTAPHLHEHDLTLAIVPAALFLKSVGDELKSWQALALIGFGLLPLVNATFAPLPPLAPIALLLVWAGSIPLSQNDTRQCLVPAPQSCQQ